MLLSQYGFLPFRDEGPILAARSDLKRALMDLMTKVKRRTSKGRRQAADMWCARGASVQCGTADL